MESLGSDFYPVILIICIFLWLSIGFCCGNIASQKGYHYGWGFVSGFLFGIVGLIYYAGLPDKNLRDLLEKYLKNTEELSKGKGRAD